METRYALEMDIFGHKKSGAGNGFLENQFLIAMPGMQDERFERSVVYLCAHSEEGAMGLIINQPQQLLFPDLLVQLDVLKEDEAIRLPEPARSIIIRNGGPVERSRGFVLHTDDYVVESSLPVADTVCLTATIDILRAISTGEGPRSALMALGYSGWGAGQLEQEIAENGWLTCPADTGLLFDGDLPSQYDRVLAQIGIDLSRLSTQAGHA
jgi:putative transcriptional regulator